VARRRQERHLQAPAAYQAGLGTRAYIIFFLFYVIKYDSFLTPRDSTFTQGVGGFIAV
jgi:hypothetical protein